jgi:hypothetical protein
MKKSILVLVVLIGVWIFKDPWIYGMRSDFSFHAFMDAAERMERALDQYPNDQFAVVHACNNTNSSIRCDGEPDGRAINVTYFIKQGEAQKVFARKRFRIEPKPQLIYGVTEFP